MNTPGSSYCVAPLTRKLIEKSVLPHPAPPHRSVGRPVGSPPPVISSKPSMPVGDLGRLSMNARFSRSSASIAIRCLPENAHPFARLGDGRLLLLEHFLPHRGVRQAEVVEHVARPGLEGLVGRHAREQSLREP